MPINQRWILPEPIQSGSYPSNLPPALGPLFARCGISDESTHRGFTAPELGDLHPASLIHGMSEATSRIGRAIRDGENILIYGDYDVDGVTSIVLLQTVLRTLGAKVDFVVPHRLVDGYGLKIEVLDRVLQQQNVKLVITVDCGITSVEPVERAIERGIDVIITDHHLPPGVLPEAAAVLNPKVPGCAYPFKELAGVGVAFKLCCELLRLAGHRLSIVSLLKIAALGTIADVAPLIGENRTIAHLGLAALADPKNLGLRALLQTLGLAGKPLRASDVGFKIGPRINAAGRLASADTAIQLFAARSEEEAYGLVYELNRLNSLRQTVEKEVLAAAEAQIDGDDLPNVLIVHGEGWHKGVVGLCAGRLAQKYHRPALVITTDGEQCVGSGRSIRTVNLHQELQAVGSLFSHFGGHDFACGFSLKKKDLAGLIEAATARFDALPGDRFVREIAIDGVVELGLIDRAFLDHHELLHPFGAGNLTPRFLIRGLRATSLREFAADCHRCEVEDGTGSARAILWPGQRELAPVMETSFDALVEVEADAWAEKGYSLILVDAVPEGCAPVNQTLRNEKQRSPVEG